MQRGEQVELLGMPASAAEFLEHLLANLVAGISAVAEAQRRGKIEIGADGMLHLPPITALADQASRFAPARPSTSSSAAYSSRTCCWRWDAATGYSEALLGHRAQSTGELVARCTALYWLTAPMRMPRASPR